MKELRTRYDNIASKFPTNGFNSQVIAKLRSLFKYIDIDGESRIWARMYTEAGYVDPGVRLIVLPLQDCHLRT